jgi:hypothetical protein
MSAQSRCSSAACRRLRPTGGPHCPNNPEAALGCNRTRSIASQPSWYARPAQFSEQLKKLLQSSTNCRQRWRGTSLGFCVNFGFVGGVAFFVPWMIRALLFVEKSEWACPVGPSRYDLAIQTNGRKERLRKKWGPTVGRGRPPGRILRSRYLRNQSVCSAPVVDAEFCYGSMSIKASRGACEAI